MTSVVSADMCAISIRITEQVRIAVNVRVGSSSSIGGGIVVRAGKVCKRFEPRCGKPATRNGFCDDHAAEADKARGTRHERGYDLEHERVRQRLILDLKANEKVGIRTQCWRCLCLMLSTQQLHADHSGTSAASGGSADVLTHARCNVAKRVPDGTPCLLRHR
jgi:hypothetical protein